MGISLDTSSRRGRHVGARLGTDLIAWLTTVRPSGRPDSVPVWFVWQGGEFLVYSRPNTTKLRNLAHNPMVSLSLDNTGGGEDVVRIEGTARTVDAYPAAHEVAAYVEKYTERIRAIGFGSAEAFARSYSVPIIITPTKFRV